jgi:hypothetical protein
VNNIVNDASGNVAVGGTLTASTITSAAATALTIKSAGTTAMTVDTSQNVGIGTTSPTSGFKLNISDTTAKTQMTSTTGTNIAYSSWNNTSGAVFVGVESSTGGSIFAGTGAYSAVFGHGGGYPVAFATSNTERMRIDSSGSLLVGCTAVPNVSISGQYGFSSSSDEVVISKNTSGTSPALYIRTNAGALKTSISFWNDTSQVGSITTTATTSSFVGTSDYRLKEDIAPLASGISTIAALKPISYKWKLDQSVGEGFIAHELGEVIPLALFGEKDAVNENGSIKPQGIDMTKIVPHLVAAIQELSAKNDALEARLAALEAK